MFVLCNIGLTAARLITTLECTFPRKVEICMDLSHFTSLHSSKKEHGDLVILEHKLKCSYMPYLVKILYDVHSETMTFKYLA